MDKYVRIVVALAIWSQMTTGRTYRGITFDGHDGFHHSFRHHDPDYWHGGYPHWGDFKDHHARDMKHDDDSKESDDSGSGDEEYWHKHHWDEKSWPGSHRQRQGNNDWYKKGQSGWNTQDEPGTWSQKRPHSWNNQGGPNSWNNHANGWGGNQAKPNSWNNQEIPNNWDYQNPNSWNQGGGWNNQNRPNSWNNWNNNQNRPEKWNNGRPNNDGNHEQNDWNGNGNNPGRPIRDPVVQATTASPTQSPTALETAQCIRTCPVTPEYNPVCGSNNVTYGNIGRLECAKFCGVVVAVQRNSPCPTQNENPVTSNPNKDIEPTRFTTIDVNPPTSRPDPDFTISPDILSSIFTTTEDDNVDIDIRTRSQMQPEVMFPADS